ncbi:PREDICTED: KH domain-containing protein HEN4 isoform X2 [Tarenaya hassleriana]|uniref:KH domain-containing protein HEN4 isoform X2 n=1 Tax=Tarenaya hassleriana TaxID=28532 RepID=UPI00053C191D|nr:PREDICTED: KH domain-containing protein HEN4 isoform X2 [Tarenaya hassleriana]XP_010550043.1 PREDICTED: KH domain-containing protein HEN4 isoform X2 [Tarenaya hassleriana]XP_010550044.1 PREDICTED: KH domain-containing protein HEN4 isoform X2 [Tarenaya hassleriana]XP_010550045.1 PREDICTED: KH domain-containing protein HEN4 isoform X2 [Tarenaya hassleriana]
MTGDQRNSHGKRSRGQSDYDENSGSKRRNRGDDRDPFVIDRDDTVYRYLCPMKKIGSVIGRGGEIVKQLRIDTKSKIRIGESVPGCEERVITIYSSSDETNVFEDGDNYISPAQDALFRIHDRVVAEDLRGEESPERDQQVTARLLVPSDQIGCVLGKGGQIVQNIRSETGAQIRIIKDRNMPPCALSSDELIQISGEVFIVRKALHQIASRLHENPSRTQHLLSSATAGLYPSGSLISPAAGAQIVGIASLMGSYGGYKSDAGDWSRPIYQAPRNEASAKEFSLRLVCPVENIGGVIGKGGTLINQLRQETKATIKVDSSKSEGNDCLITISTREYFEDAYSPTIEAAMRLLPKCSEKVERDSGLVSFTMRLLVPSSRIGCLLGKGGAIITEMRRMTKANIRILGKENLPKVASEDDEMVQISGELDVAKEALIQITSRLRANIFDREGAVSAVLPVLPYVPVAPDASDRLDYDTRDSKRLGRGNPYPGGYGSSDLPAEGYSSYGASVGGSGSAYGVYGGYTSGRSGNSGLSSHSSVSRRRSYDY